MSRFSGYVIAFVIFFLSPAIRSAGGQVSIPGRSIVSDTAKTDSSAKKSTASFASNTKKSASTLTPHSQECIKVTKEGQRKCLQIDTVNVYHTDTVTIAGRNIVHTNTIVRYDTVYVPVPKEREAEVKSGFPIWRTIGGVALVGTIVTAAILAARGSKGCGSSSSSSSAGGAAASAAAGCGSSSSSSSASHNLLFGLKHSF